MSGSKSGERKSPTVDPKTRARPEEQSSLVLAPLTPQNKVLCLFELGDATFLFPVIFQPPAADLQIGTPSSVRHSSTCVPSRTRPVPMAAPSVMMSHGLERPALLLPGKKQNGAKEEWRFCKHSWLRQPQWEGGHSSACCRCPGGKLMDASRLFPSQPRHSSISHHCHWGKTYQPGE